MVDVFDGWVWRDFQIYEGVPFLAAPRNYAFMLNVDWMQPFNHTTYSIGVIYLVLMNLPRAERFKKNNVILLGVIPGPSEPPLTINTYLSPLADELLILWNDGIMIRRPGLRIVPEQFKAALLCVACDIPASRKVWVSLVIIRGWGAISAPRLSLVEEYVLQMIILRTTTETCKYVI